MNHSWLGLVGMKTHRVMVSSFRINCSADQCEKLGIGVAVAGGVGRTGGGGDSLILMGVKITNLGALEFVV